MASSEGEIVQILSTKSYETQLKVILEKFLLEDMQATKKFKLYLDTILVNLPTKVNKYKASPLFDNENIREIPHEGYRIIFFYDKDKNNYLIMGIIEK